MSRTMSSTLLRPYTSLPVCATEPVFIIIQLYAQR
jgi:hypothetical protein